MNKVDKIKKEIERHEHKIRELKDQLDGLALGEMTLYSIKITVCLPVLAPTKEKAVETARTFMSEERPDSVFIVPILKQSALPKSFVNALPWVDEEDLGDEEIELTCRKFLEMQEAKKEKKR